MSRSSDIYPGQNNAAASLDTCTLNGMSDKTDFLTAMFLIPHLS